MEKEIGRVVTWFENRNYGFLQRPDGSEIFFHRRAVIGPIPALESLVTFVSGKFGNKSCALQVEAIKTIVAQRSASDSSEVSR